MPQWSNNAGYAHASEPAVTGVSRISSPVITVPSNVSKIILSMGHKFDIEDTWDCAQLLVSKNGATATVVTTFTAGGYTTGGDTNPATCALGTQSQFPGWSGSQTEEVSTVNLTTILSVVAGDTVTITFRMVSDITMSGNGWDINWVTLSANSP